MLDDMNNNGIINNNTIDHILNSNNNIKEKDDFEL